MRRFLPPSPFSVLSSYRYQILQSIVFILIFAFALYKAGAGTSGIFVELLSARSERITREYLSKEAEYSREQNIQLANDPKLAEIVERRDTQGLLTYILKKKTELKLGFISVVDKNGFIISRTKERQTGDNVYLGSDYGYQVGNGKTILSYEENSRDPYQAGILAGKPIISQGEQIGAVFSGMSFDDEYANQVASIYANSAVRIIFYTKDGGVIGSNFPNGGDQKEFNRIFGPGSKWIASGLTKEVAALGGSYYYVRNVPLISYDGTQDVGMLLLFPLFIHFQFFVFAVVMLYLMYLIWKPSIRKVKNSLRLHVLEIAIAVLATLLLLFVATVFYGRILWKTRDIVIPELSIYNSTMRLSPDSGVFDQAYEQRISVMVDTGGEDINSVGAKLTYDPDKLKIADIDTSTSECDEYLEKTVDAINGKIRLICMLKIGDERPKSFNVGTLVVQPISGGSTMLHIDNNSQVLANDGFATDVLRNITDATYTLVSDATFIWNDTLAKDKKLIVHSLSHSNESRWYPNDKVSFVWSAVNNAMFSYALIDPTTRKTILSGTSTQNSAMLTVPKSATYEMRVIAWSPKSDMIATGTTSVRVDITPPDNVEVIISHYSIKVGEVVRMILKGDDYESGLSSNYYVSIDGNTLLPVGGLVFIPFTNPGTKEITVRIFDKAGNYVDKTKYIRVGK